MPEKTLESLPEGEVRFSSVVNQMSVGVAQCDLAGRFVLVNDKYCEIIDYPREELLEKRMQEITHSDDLPLNEKLFQKCIDEGAPFTLEKRYVRKDGSEVRVKNSVSLLRDAAGKPQYVLAVVVDITDEKLAQNALLQSEERYRALIDASAQTVLTMDATGGRDLHRQWFSQLTGIPADELQEMNLIHPDDREYLQKVWSRVMKKPSAYEVAFRLRSKSGNYAFYNLRGIPIFNADGSLREWIGMVRDVTDQREAQIALRESEESYRTLAETALDAIIKIDENSRILFVNTAAERIFGYTVSELIGQSLTKLMPEELRDQHLAGFSRYLKTGERSLNWASIEVPARHKDGHHFPLEISFSEYNRDGNRFFIGIARDIRQRKEIEKATAHLAAIVASSDDAIISKNLDGIITSWNRGAEKIFGYTADEAIGKSIMMLIPPHRVNEEPKIIERIRRGEGVEHYETQRRRKDGIDLEISLTVSPIRDESGIIIGASKIARDITERKEAEEALRESQAILSLSMRSSRMGAWVQDVKTDYVWWSEELQEIFGLEKGSFSNTRKGFYEFVHPDDSERILGEVQQAIKEHRDYTIEFRFQHTDGSLRWMEGRGQAFYSEKGEVVRLYGIGIDVTGRKQIQQQLIAAERRAAEDYQKLLSRIVPLAQTLGTARDLISIYQAVREFVSSSMRCTAFFVSFYDAAHNLRHAAYAWGEEGEVDISTLPPMPLTENGGPNSQAVFQKKTIVVSRYMDLMKDRPHVVLQDNGIAPMSSMVVPMTVMNRITGTLEVQAYENDAFTHEHIVAMEMVANLAAVAIENVRLLQVEERARHEAETANRAKDEFLSVLSHELRTPLNSMFGWTRMLRAGILDEAKTQQAIEVIERNVRLQNNLIEDMLDVSRIITGKMRIEKEEIDFAAIVKAAVEAARPSAEQKTVSLVFHSDADSYLLSGDEVRLQQIVNNLINNAIKFTSEGGAVVLSLSAGADESVSLSVTDTGIGIETDFLPQIFDRFRQADSTTRRTHSGLGLGLTIVRHLTELHGGRVSAESEGIGKGANFIIELPLLPKTSADSAGNTLAGAANGNGFSLKGSRILLVDDDCDAMLPLQIILENQEAEVFCASSVSEALQRLSEDKFSLLVSDIGMPEMDGYDLITALRKMDASANHDIPAIALTAYASTQDKRRALMSGFQHHFAKPLDFEQFLATVNSLIQYSNNK